MIRTILTKSYKQNMLVISCSFRPSNPFVFSKFKNKSAELAEEATLNFSHQLHKFRNSDATQATFEFNNTLKKISL